MSASKHTKILSVRLPEPDVVRLKIVAASRGVTVQQAVREALDVWTSPRLKTPLKDLNALRGSLSDSIDVQTQREQERQAELTKDRLKIFGV